MDLCYLLVLIVVVIMMIYGFMLVIKNEPEALATGGKENEEQVISRQLKGFGWLVLSQVILILGAMLCFNTGSMSLKGIGESLNIL